MLEAERDDPEGALLLDRVLLCAFRRSRTPLQLKREDKPEEINRVYLEIIRDVFS